MVQAALALGARGQDQGFLVYVRQRDQSPVPEPARNRAVTEPAVPRGRPAYQAQMRKWLGPLPVETRHWIGPGSGPVGRTRRALRSSRPSRA
jgi:hypothetical protein